MDGRIKYRYPLEIGRSMPDDGRWAWNRLKPLAWKNHEYRASLQTLARTVQQRVCGRRRVVQRAVVFALHLRDEVAFDQEPAQVEATEGWLPVQVVERRDNNFLVRLPQSTVENGQYLAVRSHQLRKANEPIRV